MTTVKATYNQRQIVHECWQAEKEGRKVNFYAYSYRQWNNARKAGLIDNLGMLTEKGQTVEREHWEEVKQS